MKKTCLVVAFALLPVLSAPGFGAVVTFSDTWICGGLEVVYDEAADEFEIIADEDTWEWPNSLGVCGCGITDGSLDDTESHEYSAYVKVSNPSGTNWQENTALSLGMGTVARADIGLQFGQGSEEGLYTTVTRHWSDCPPHLFGGSSTQVLVNLAWTSYIFSHFSPSYCHYVKDCPPGVWCGPDRLRKKRRPDAFCRGYGIFFFATVNGICTKGWGAGVLTPQRMNECFKPPI